MKNIFDFAAKAIQVAVLVVCLAILEFGVTHKTYEYAVMYQEIDNALPTDNKTANERAELIKPLAKRYADLLSEDPVTATWSLACEKHETSFKDVKIEDVNLGYYKLDWYFSDRGHQIWNAYGYKEKPLRGEYLKTVKAEAEALCEKLYGESFVNMIKVASAYYVDYIKLVFMS